MKNVSNLFKQVIKEGGPFYAYASVKLADGTTFTLDANDDFYISGNNYSQSGGGGFPLGSVISKTIDIAIDNTDGRFSGYDFYKAEITLYTEADIAHDPILKDVSDDAITDHSGNNIITDYAKTERILEGIFTVASPVSTGDLIEIVAYDGVKKLDSVYTPTNAIVFPTTAMAIYQDICNRRGLSVGSSTFPNSDYQIDSIPENVTCRQMIGYIAMIAVGNAFCSATNALIIKPYDFSLFENMPLLSGGSFGNGISDSVTGGSFGDALEDYISANELGDGDYHILSDFPSDFTVSTDDVVITGIKIDVETEGEEGTETETLLYGTEGYCLKVENPLASGKEEDLIEIIGDALIGTILRPFSGEFFPDPTIEFMDLVYLIDRKDNIYQSFITDNTFTYLGNSELSNDMEDPTRNESEYYSQATEVYRKNRQEIDNLKTTYEIALEQLANQIATSSGLYTTEEVQEDGSTIFYMHDKPTLEESQIIWTMTANGFAVSNDGGESYVAGLTVDGNFIANILTAIGINADWINSGAITIKDQNGNITFLADTATGNVEIRANTFTLGSQTIPEIAEEKSENAVNDFVDAVYSPQIANLQAQIDGQIETYYYDYEPTLNNEPASKWTTEEERQAHEGDLFYWKSKGYAYRFFKDGSTWKWQMVQDTDITKALEQASEAQDTADQKRRVFVVTPTPPYDVGDLWAQGTAGDIMRCQTARQTGNYNSADWVKASKYTDDSAVEDLDESLDQQEVFNRLTNNGQLPGLFMYNNQLYVNASYIRSGEINTDLLNVNEIFAKNITATGTITGATLKGSSGEFTKSFNVDILYKNPELIQTKRHVIRSTSQEFEIGAENESGALMGMRTAGLQLSLSSSYGSLSVSGKTVNMHSSEGDVNIYSMNGDVIISNANMEKKITNGYMRWGRIVLLNMYGLRPISPPDGFLPNENVSIPVTWTDGSRAYNGWVQFLTDGSVHYRYIKDDHGVAEPTSAFKAYGVAIWTV